MLWAPGIYLVKAKDDGWLEAIFHSEAEAKHAAAAAGLDSGLVHVYPGIHGRIPSPMHPGWLAEMHKRGYMARKADLKDGAWYLGRCRQANLAQWDAKRGVFMHWREKFGKVFPEDIRHPEDDDGFDLFWPVEEVRPPIETPDLRGKERTPAMFRRYIGIDYSGAKTPTSRLRQLQVYQACRNEDPRPVLNHGKNWTRKALAHWLADRLAEDEPTIVGIDHAFSFPFSYIDRHKLQNLRWEQILDDFHSHWPTDNDDATVDAIRRKNPKRTGSTQEFRITDRRSSSAKSIFQLDGQGIVGKSTYAGLPWLLFLRREKKLRGKIQFWPFEGFKPREGRSIIAEVYPSLFRRRYPKTSAAPTPDAHDAYVVARWLQETDHNDLLKRYFDPPLTEGERIAVGREGWILGLG